MMKLRMASVAVTEMLLVACGPVWDEAQQVCEENEEEERQDERDVSVAVRSDVGHDDLVPHVQNRRFDSVAEPLRRSSRCMAAAVCTRGNEHDDCADRGGEDHVYDMSRR
jgi:hypothetical protein